MVQVAMFVGALGLIAFGAGLAIAWERRADDPGYEPQHAAREDPQDELERALTAPRRTLSHPSPWSPAPWHPAAQRHSDETPRR